MSVRSVVIIAKHAQLLTDADSGLCQIRNEILGHTVGQLAYLSRGMRTDGIEIAEYYALEGAPDLMTSVMMSSEICLVLP